MAKLFRKNQGDTPSSPEALDSLLQITNPRGWAILATIAVCILGGLSWGIWGRIPYTISGEGILFNRQGLFTLQSNGSGVLENLYFGIGDWVDAGKVVARVAGADLYHKVVGAEDDLNLLRSKYESIKTFGDQELVRKKEALAEQLRDAEFVIASAQAKTKWLGKKFLDQEELFKVGLITQNDVQATKEQLDTAKESIIKNNAERKEIKVQSDQLANDLEQKLRDLNLQIASAQNNLQIVRATYNQVTRIVTPRSGFVVGIGSAEGERVTPGQTIVSLSLGARHNDSLETVLYFPAAQAKRITRGMLIMVSPGTVKVDNYGYALGLVTDVADYPATPDEMKQVLKNEGLIGQMQKMGAALEVRAALIPNPRTISGFTWTSSKGPPVSIQEGTPCTAQVVVEQNPPITLVVPMLKRFFLGVGEKG